MMNHRRTRVNLLNLLLGMLLILPAAVLQPARADNYYSDQQLASDRTRYGQRFQFLLNKGLLEFMTSEERRALSGVAINHPLRGKNPLDFSSLPLEGDLVVIAPVLSMKFIEDLSIAYAWRFQKRFSLEPMDEYLSMLKYRSSKDFPGGELPSPLRALGVPENISETDNKTDDLSLRFRNTAWAFILAHELGHLRYGHSRSRVDPAEIQRQEEQADAFAIDLLARSRTIPMGMILWFQATAAYLPNRADFPSLAAYLQWSRTEANHPVNGKRLKNLAERMARQARSESDANHASLLNYIATRLAKIGPIIDDPEMQMYLRRCAQVRQPQDLKRRENRSCV